MKAIAEQGPSAEGWGVLRTIVGAPPRVLNFAAGQPLHIEIGSRPECALFVPARGVAALHFEVIWDGTFLWLQDALRLGRTLVNGETLNDWMPVLDSAVILFGGACCVARASGPLCWAAGPDFDALERTKLTGSGRIRKDDTVRMRIVSSKASP